MNHLDNLKRQIVEATAAQAMNRLNVRNERLVFTSQELHEMLTHAASAAIELWNGHLQAEVHLIEMDAKLRLDALHRRTPNEILMTMDLGIGRRAVGGKDDD